MAIFAPPTFNTCSASLDAQATKSIRLPVDAIYIRFNKEHRYRDAIMFVPKYVLKATITKCWVWVGQSQSSNRFGSTDPEATHNCPLVEVYAVRPTSYRIVVERVAHAGVDILMRKLLLSRSLRGNAVRRARLAKAVTHTKRRKNWSASQTTATPKFQSRLLH